jgi:hypothetical protein
MNSDLLNIASLERQRYVDFFIDEIDLLKNGKDICATELPIEVSDETISYPFNTVYLDFIYKDENNEDHISELRLDNNLDYDMCCFYLGKMKVELFPFCWNSCEFTVEQIEVSALANWVIKWLKVDEELPDIELAEAIHSCSQPDLVDKNYSFTIDFGSAPAACFIDFLQFLRDSRTEYVRVETSEA